MYKIIITGSSGKLGFHLSKNLSKYYKIYNIGKKKRKFDLTKKSKITKYLLAIKPDFILNCAAIADIDQCERKKEKTTKVNVGIVKNLIDIKKKFNLKFKLIQISTDQMYDNYNSIRNKEGSKPKINNFYTKQKLMAERISLTQDSIILRTNFFGFTNNRINQTFTDWLYKNAKDKKLIHLFEDVTFNPVRIKTIEQVIRKIIKYKNTRFRGIYNIGCVNGLSKKDFALKFLKKFKNLKYKTIKYSKVLQTKRSKNMIMNIKKFEKHFKFKLPKIDNEIKKELHFYEKNYNK